MHRLWSIFAVSLTTICAACGLAVASATSRHPAAPRHKVHSITVRRPRRPRHVQHVHRLHKTNTATPLKTKQRASGVGVDPVLFGDQTIESGRDAKASGLAEAFPFSNPAAGTTASIDVYVDSTNVAKTLVAGLYSNRNGHPSSLLARGSVSSPTAGAWNAVPIGTASVSAGHTYWIAVLGTGGTLALRDRATGSCTSETSSQTALTALPSTWKTGSRSSSCPVSAYVNGYLAVTVAPPTNSAVPKVSGNPKQGQVLTTDNGSWSGSPTSYAIQWQQCDTSGSNCTAIANATTSSYTLTPSDVAHTIRSVVTATNAGGSASATSAVTAVVTEIAPTAAFTYSPASPVTGQAVHFDASASSCANGPCTYTWDDDGPDGPGGTDWALGTGQSLDFTFQQAATKFVRVTVTDSFGGSATIEHDVVVGQAPQAPANTALPTVSGTTQQSQMLTTSDGSWSNSPTTYSYQWQDCDSSGNTCTNLVGATSSSYMLSSGDVGHEMRAVVKATNSTGSVAATSTATSVVAAAPAPPSSLTLPGTQRTSVRASR